ncbi:MULTISPECIES: hypothetical protein [Hydrogenophaga]|uniref:Flagellar protein FlgN n=2 Tax=Hydrogenophaga TaxID=47420 RepID=A0ABW2QK09_9BURK
MSSPSSLPGPDEVLRYVEQQLDRVDAALRNDQPDQLTTEVEALGRGIALFQQVFHQMKDGAASEWQPKLSAANGRLQALQQQLMARSAAVNRALGTLFPAEQGNAYARLGGKSGMGGLPRVSNHTSFKA